MLGCLLKMGKTAGLINSKSHGMQMSVQVVQQTQQFMNSSS